MQRYNSFVVYFYYIGCRHYKQMPKLLNVLSGRNTIYIFWVKIISVVKRPSTLLTSN